MLRIPLATVKLVALGAFLWLVGRGLAAGLPTAIGKWVVGVSVVIGLVLMIRGVLLTTRSRARVMSQWRAEQASALGPPPTEPQPPAP